MQEFPAAEPTHARDTGRAMSEENVETIRAFYEVYNRRDFDALPKPLHPDIELIPAGDQAPIKGPARVRAWMEPDAFESQVIDLLDLRVVGDKVLVRGRTKIRGAGSGIEAEYLFWAVWTFDEAGVPTRVEIYLGHQEAEALKAAGLSD
jgi:ketosteroid isomerase-like protein